MTKVEKLIRKFEKEYRKGNMAKVDEISEELKKLNIYTGEFAGYIEFINTSRVNTIYSIKMKEDSK